MAKKNENITKDDGLVQLAEVFAKNIFKITELNLKILENNIKMCEDRKRFLLNNPPLIFSKKRRKEYENELEEIDKEIMKYYKDISLELKELKNI